MVLAHRRSLYRWKAVGLLTEPNGSKGQKRCADIGEIDQAVCGFGIGRQHREKEGCGNQEAIWIGPRTSLSNRMKPCALSLPRPLALLREREQFSRRVKHRLRLVAGSAFILRR